MNFKASPLVSADQLSLLLAEVLIVSLLNEFAEVLVAVLFGPLEAESTDDGVPPPQADQDKAQQDQVEESVLKNKSRSVNVCRNHNDVQESRE